MHIFAISMVFASNPTEVWPKLLLTYGPCALFVFFAYVLEKKANERMKASPGKKAPIVIYYLVWLLMFAFAIVITVVWLKFNFLDHEFRIRGRLAGLRGEEELRTRFKQMYIRREYENPSHFDYDWLVLSPSKLPEGSIILLVIDRSAPPNHEDIATYKLPISNSFYDPNNEIELQYDRTKRTISFDPGNGATVLNPSPYEAFPQEAEQSKLDKLLSQIVGVVYAQSTPDWKGIAERLQSPDPIIRLETRAKLASFGPAAIPFIQDILSNPKAAYFLRLGAISALDKMPDFRSAMLNPTSWCSIVHASKDNDEALRSAAQSSLKKSTEINQDMCESTQSKNLLSDRVPPSTSQRLKQDKDLAVWFSLRAFKAASSPSERSDAQAALRKTVWQAQAMPTIKIGDNRHHITGFGFSQDATKMITLEDRTPRKVDIWDVESGRLLNSLTGNTSSVLTAVFSPDNKVIVTGTRDGKATFWEIETGRRLRIIDNETAVAHIAISPDGKRMAVSDDSEHRELSSDNRARLWNLSGQTPKPLDIYTALYGSVSQIEFSPDGTLLALGTVNGDVLLYGNDRGLPRLEKRLNNDTNPIRKIVFSRQAARIAALDNNKHLRMWDTESYLPQKMPGGIQGIVDDIAFSSNGALFVSAIERNGRQLTVSNAQSSRNDQKSELNLDFYPDSWISAFSADATLLVIADKYHQSLRIYAQDADRMFEFAKRYVELHRKLTDSECSLYFHEPMCSHLP